MQLYPWFWPHYIYIYIQAFCFVMGKIKVASSPPPELIINQPQFNHCIPKCLTVQNHKSYNLDLQGPSKYFACPLWIPQAWCISHWEGNSKRYCITSPLIPVSFSPHSEWIGLRENLQETIDFPIKYGAFL